MQKDRILSAVLLEVFVLSPLLATKLYIPPARLNRVPCPQQNEQLNIKQPLILIAAFPNPFSIICDQMVCFRIHYNVGCFV